MYLNYFDFLHNAVGIKNASNVYFSKEPKDLKLEEAATLIGLCKNPSFFNPVRYPDRCRERRNVVLGQMLKAGKITRGEYLMATEKPLALNFKRSDHKDGSNGDGFLRLNVATNRANVEDGMRRLKKSVEAYVK